LPALFILGGLSGQIEGLPGLLMHPFNVGLKPGEIEAKTIGAKFEGLGDEKGLLATATAFDNSFGT